ncbi:MAG: tRNA pseudouridine(38-40) synthase TruA [Candidatus Methanospirareceae archaeon]
MEEKRRVALKIGYIGTNYHGFQIQPDVPTIEGEIFKALKKLDILEDRKKANYSSSGRTDKGVHAISQVISFDTSHPKISPRMLNSELPEDIFAFAMATPYEGFDARRDAISREYRYFLFNDGLDVEKMKEASKLFVGTHNFFNFSYGYSSEKATIKRIYAIDMEERGNFIVIDVKARSFLRMMVRKIVGALKMVGEGLKDEVWIEDLLELRLKERIEAAPAHGLILKDVVYRGVEFEEDEYAKGRIIEKIKEEVFFHSTIVEVLEEMRKSLG